MMMTVEPEVERALTRGAAAERFAATNAVAERFFSENADAIARACQAMAGRFQRGGRLFVCGDGAQRSDVAHVVVEFVHPVVVGKRAIPALPLPDMRLAAARARRGPLQGLRDDPEHSRRRQQRVASVGRARLTPPAYR